MLSSMLMCELLPSSASILPGNASPICSTAQSYWYEYSKWTPSALCPALTAGTGRWAISRSPTHPDPPPGPDVPEPGCGTEERIAPSSISRRIGVEQTCSNFFRMGLQLPISGRGPGGGPGTPINMLDELSCSCTSISLTYAYFGCYIIRPMWSASGLSMGSEFVGCYKDGFAFGASSEPRRVSNCGGSQMILLRRSCITIV